MRRNPAAAENVPQPERKPFEQAVYAVATSPLLQAIVKARAAVNGDSNDEEHDALVALLEALGVSLDDSAEGERS